MENIEAKLAKWAYEAKTAAALEKELLAKYPQMMNRNVTMKELATIAKDVPVIDAEELTGSVFMISAFRNGYHFECLAFADIGCYRLKYSSIKLLDQFVDRTSNVHHLKTLIQVLGKAFYEDMEDDKDKKKTYYLPYVNQDYTLMPLGSTYEAGTSWINPSFLESVVQEDTTLYLHYSFGLTLECNVKDVKTIIKRMRLAFQAFGLYQRDIVSRPTFEQQSLKSFLQLRSTDLVDRATQGATVQDIPGKKRTLVTTKHEHYVEVYEMFEGNFERVERYL